MLFEEEEKAEAKSSIKAGSASENSGTLEEDEIFSARTRVAPALRAYLRGQEE